VVRLARVTGVVGLLSIVLVFASVIIIGEGEPRNLATLNEAAATSATPTSHGCSRRSPCSGRACWCSCGSLSG
jgi:hypothetical protein